MSKTKQDYPKTLKDYQEAYADLESRESNRLTFSTFLGGLTFAAFAAFESSPIRTSIATFNAQSGLALSVAISLGVSTLIFLAVAASSHQAIRHLSNVSQESKTTLATAGTPDDSIPQTLTTERYRGDKKIGSDLDKIRSAWAIHQESDRAVNLGFLILMLALILIGVEANYSVGIVVTIALLIIGYYFKTVRNMLGSWLRSKVSKL